MRTAVIAVDVQEDFYKPDGALGGEGREEIVEPLMKLADQADLFISTGDRHPKGHISHSPEPEYRDGSWPAHCLSGTEGCRLHPLVDRRSDYTVWKGQEVDKEAYSGFDGATDDGRTLIDILHAHSIERVIVVGLLLGDEDVPLCVGATALDAAEEGFVTVVYTKAVRGLTDTLDTDWLAGYNIRVSYEEPRGERKPSRQEAIEDAIEELVHCGELAEHANQHRLSAHFGSLCVWVRHMAEGDSSFTVTYPDPYLDDANVRVIAVPPTILHGDAE